MGEPVAPFIAVSVSKFWRRWHISLTTWVNEYIYNPIAIHYRNWNKWATVYAVFITFLILGFWHGASWNYIIFGILQGFIIAVESFTSKSRKKIRSYFPEWFNNFIGIIFTFGYFCFSCIFFRAQTANDAIRIFQRIFTSKGGIFIDLNTMVYGIVGILFLAFIGILGYTNNFQQYPFKSKHWWKLQLFYATLIIFILLTGVFDGSQFIYFQF